MIFGQIGGFTFTARSGWEPSSWTRWASATTLRFTWQIGDFRVTASTPARARSMCCKFVNQKAEAHWTFRSHLQENLISGLTDEETAAQLSTIRYRENSRGLTEIESKEARNQRGIPGSPDRAESLIIAFLRVIPQHATVMYDAGYDHSGLKGAQSDRFVRQKYLPIFRDIAPRRWGNMVASSLMQDRGLTGHRGSHGSDCAQCISYFGNWSSSIGEGIRYGQADGEAVILQLLIDDGVDNRVHRKSCSIHAGGMQERRAACIPATARMFVLDFAAGYQEQFVKPIRGGRRTTGTGAAPVADLPWMLLRPLTMRLRDSNVRWQRSQRAV
jgi:hypothetical protein